MQARKTKLDRILTRAARAAARPTARIARRVARLDASIPMSPRKATVNEARKRAAAQPDAIKAVRAAYRAQCIARPDWLHGGYDDAYDAALAEEGLLDRGSCSVRKG